MNATPQSFRGLGAISDAFRAAENAIAGGIDYSNGAYFWDGSDIKSNDKNHRKVVAGISFSDPFHNIFDIPESINGMVCIEKTRYKSRTMEEARVVGRSTSTYESTASQARTIFWRFSRDYIGWTNRHENE